MRDPADTINSLQVEGFARAEPHCCKASGSWTKDNTLIVMRDTGKTPPPPPPGDKSGPIEASWGAHGATCVSHLRLWVDGSDCAKEEETQLVEKLDPTAA